MIGTMSLKPEKTRVDKSERCKRRLEGEPLISIVKKYTVKVFKRYWQYPACALLLISSFSVTASDKPVLTLVTGDLVPGFYHSSEQTGLLDDVVEQALQRMGYGLNILTVPAERSLKMAEAGLADGDLLRTTAIEEYFPTLLQVPEVLLQSEFVVFSREAVDLKNGWQSLSGKSVGIIFGMKIIEKKVPASALVTKVKNETQLFALLLKKRIDYAVFIRDIGLYHLHKNTINGLVVSDTSLDHVPSYVYLHPKHAALVPRLASALQAMKQDGSYQYLVDQHLQAINIEKPVAPELEKK